MTTIEEVKNLITSFKLDPDEVYHYLNKDLDHIAYVSFKAKQFATAMEVYKYMVVNKIDRIEKPYYINHMIDKEFIMTDYADTIEKINPNAYRIILSIRDETQIAKQNNYINVTYSKLFEF